jgi:two-component sensor histidine kinase
MSRRRCADVETVRKVLFPCIPQAAGYVRRYIRAYLDTEDESAVYVIGLMTCELVTNSVLHSRPAKANGHDCPRHIGLTIARNGSTIRIEVADGGSDESFPHIAEATDEHGRGLQIVKELSDRWGFERYDDRTIVWFEKRITASEPSRNVVADQLAALAISPAELAALAISPAEMAAENEPDSGEGNKAS